MPVWNIGRPSTGCTRGPKGEVSPPGTGWMKLGRPAMGAAMASAASGVSWMAGNMNSPPPRAEEKAEPAEASVTAPVLPRALSARPLRAASTAATASSTAAGVPAARTTDALGDCGALPPRNGSRAKSSIIAEKGTSRPLSRMLRTSGPLRCVSSRTCEPPPSEASNVCPTCDVEPLRAVDLPANDLGRPRVVSLCGPVHHRSTGGARGGSRRKMSERLSGIVVHKGQLGQMPDSSPSDGWTQGSGTKSPRRAAALQRVLGSRNLPSRYAARGGCAGNDRVSVRAHRPVLSDRGCPRRRGR